MWSIFRKDCILGNTFNAVADILKGVRDIIYTQEQKLFKDRITQNSYYFYKKDREMLVKLILNDHISFELPKNSIPSGNYLI